jgi:hypothetical protein
MRMLTAAEVSGMFRSDIELKQYVVENFRDVTDSRFDDSHWDLECTICRVRRGFQLLQRLVAGYETEYRNFVQDSFAPYVYVFVARFVKRGYFLSGTAG